MTWRTETVAPERLEGLLEQIRGAGGTVTRCQPQRDGVHVTWALPSGGGAAPTNRSSHLPNGRIVD